MSTTLTTKQLRKLILTEMKTLSEGPQVRYTDRDTEELDRFHKHFWNILDATSRIEGQLLQKLGRQDPDAALYAMLKACDEMGADPEGMSLLLNDFDMLLQSALNDMGRALKDEQRLKAKFGNSQDAD
jgi:hypothetical protein